MKFISFPKALIIGFKKNALEKKVNGSRICIWNWDLNRFSLWLDASSQSVRKLKHQTEVLQNRNNHGAYKWFLWHQKICQFSH